MFHGRLASARYARQSLLPFQRRISTSRNTYNEAPHYLPLNSSALAVEGQNALSQLRLSLHASSLPYISNAYQELVEVHRRAFHPNTKPIVHIEDIHFLVDALAPRLGPKDVRFLTSILENISGIFGLKHTDTLHLPIFNAFLRHNNLWAAHAWLTSLARLSDTYRLPMRVLDRYINHCEQLGEARWAIKGLMDARKSGLRPTKGHFIQAVHIMHRAGSCSYHDLFRALRLSGLIYDEEIENTLCRPVAARHPEQADHLRNQYRQVFPSANYGGEDIDSNLSMLEIKALEDGVGAAIDSCKTLQDEGYTVTPDTLSAILKCATDISDIQHVENILNVGSTVDHFALIIGNNAVAGNLRKAWETYLSMKAFGMQPRPSHVFPLINALCIGSMGPPTEKDIDQALALYEDASVSIDANPYDSFNSDTYAALLRALSTHLSGSRSKYGPIVSSILQDMQAKNIKLPEGGSAAIIIMMRLSDSFQGAFSIYKRFASQPETSLDLDGYLAILKSYLQLPFGVPDMKHYLYIISDMRMAGHPSHIEIYTSALKVLAQRANELSTAALGTPMLTDKHLRLREVVDAIFRIHRQVTVDTVEPEERFWVQLLTAYQLSGQYQECLSIWDTLFLRGQLYPSCVDILFTVCGQTGDDEKALQILRHLQQNKSYILTRRNWVSWIECQCRLGKFAQAIHSLCTEMPSPDMKIITTVLDYAGDAGYRRAAEARISKLLPHVYKTKHK